MLEFKAILVKMGKEYFIYFNDSETILRGTNKFKILRTCQDEIIKEIKRRGDIFTPSYEKKGIVLRKRGYEPQKDDVIEVYEFKIEFEYRTYRFARIDFDPISSEVVNL